MEKDMSFGGGSNNRTSMSRGTEGLDITDLYQNEESIDLSTYMNSANLELCDDDLFQSLFPTNTESENNVKVEKHDQFEPELNDWWTDPSSAYACSSAAQSPVQFFNTPPVTPKSEAHTISPEGVHQARQERQAQFSMSRTQLNPMLIMEEQSNIVSNVGANEVSPVSIKSDPDAPQMNGMYFIKSDDDMPNNVASSTALLPALIQARPNDTKYEYLKTKQESSDLQNDAEIPAKRSKTLVKDTNEYKMKRERNNIAVRKSRDKAKMKSVETQKKVSELSSENKRLRDRVNELTHELNTLKNILKSLPQTSHLSK